MPESQNTSHEQGLVSVLKQLHDELDAAVAAAYGWPVDLSDAEILERLVALNKERAQEEQNGLIRWLRPEYQNPSGASQQTQVDLPQTTSATPSSAKQKPPWPKTLPEQVAAVHTSLTQQSAPLSAAQLKEQFNAREPKVAEILAALASIGQAREVEGGCFVR